MKLSEISTEKAFDVLCEMTPHINNIVSDSDLLRELKSAVKADETTTKAEWVALGVGKINKLMPIILKKHKRDMFGIIGVVNGVSIDDIAKQNFLVTAKQIKEIIRDKDLLDFFKSCAGTEGSE